MNMTNILKPALDMISHSKFILGVEISENVVKLAVIKEAGKDRQVVFLDSAAVKDVPDDKKAELIIAGVEKSGYKISETVLVLSTSLVITKTLQIPSVKDDEINDILNLQAGRHTPYSREELVLNYISLGSVQNTYTNVLVVMVAREVIKKRLDILEMAGFKCGRIFFAAEGIARIISGKLTLPPDKPPKVILNMDKNSSDFCVFGSSGLMFVRNIPVGESHIKDNQADALTRLAEEIKKSFEAYGSEDISGKPDTVYLSCKGPTGEEIRESLQEKTMTEVQQFFIDKYARISDPYDKQAVQSGTDSFSALIGTLECSGGLSIDLTPEEMKDALKFKSRARKLIAIGILCMVIFVQICLIFLVKVYYREKYLTRLEEEFRGKIEETEDLRLLSDKMRVMRKFLVHKGDSIKVLASLHDILPDEIYLNDIKMDDESGILIQGTSSSMSRIFELVTKLENDDMYKSVKTEFTESGKKDGKDVFNFGITMDREK